MKRHVDIIQSYITRCEQQNLPLDKTINDALALYFIMVETTKELLSNPSTINIPKSKSKLSASDFSELTQSETKPVYEKNPQPSNKIPMFDPFSIEDEDKEIDDIPF